MIEIQNINFKLKTIDNVKCFYGNVKDIQMSMIRNTFTVHVNYNEGETFTTEYKKPKENDTIEEVNMNISCMVKEVKDEIQEELKEHEEELKEHEEDLKEEPKMTIEELKEILTETLDKKNTALSYFRTIKQVYDYFKSDDMYTLLQKEQDIIHLLKTNIKRVYTLFPVSYAVY